MLGGYLFFLPIIFIDQIDADSLLLVQAVWRHGDRTPTYTCNGDNNTEEKWERFGGFEQLTPTGMAQHVKLGELIHDRYISNMKFLNEKYNSREIYIRSTDLNRTLLSAVSNMIGMYYDRNNSVAGNDYPINDRWPDKFVPIAIHTIDDSTDYVANPDSRCPRQEWLWKQAEKTPEMIHLRKVSQELMENLTKICHQQTDLVNNLWRWRDSFYIERIYNLTLPVSEEQYQLMTQYNNVVEDMQNGINISEYDGINFRHELGKIRGGGILWEMIKHNDLKLHCLEGSNAENSECEWMNELRYYAYSAHDTTVGAMLAAVGAKEETISENGYPAYTSAVIMELWNSTTDGFCIKVLFHRNFSTTFEDITSWTNGCDGYTCCPFKVFREFSKPYYPSNDEAKLCQDISSKSTYFDPDKEESSSEPKTTVTASLITSSQSSDALAVNMERLWRSMTVLMLLNLFYSKTL